MSSQQHLVRVRVSWSKMLEEKRLKSDRNTNRNLLQHKKPQFKDESEIIHPSDSCENETVKNSSKSPSRQRLIASKCSGLSFISVLVFVFCCFHVESVSANSQDDLIHHQHHGRVCSHRHPKDNEVGNLSSFYFKNKYCKYYSLKIDMRDSCCKNNIASGFTFTILS